MRALQHFRAYFFVAFAALLSTLALAQVPTVPWPPSPPVKLAVNPVTNKVYLVNEGANTVTVLDAANNVSRTIPVGPRPFYIAANPATNRIYVNNAGDSSVTVIDGASDTVMLTLPIGSVGPIQINPVTNVVYVVRLTGPSTDEVTFINGDNHSYYTIATESFQPIAVALNPVTNTMYIAHYATGDVRVISAAMTGNAHPATVSIGVWSRPFAIAANPITNKVYVITEDARGPIGIIDGATNTATFPAIPAGRLTGPRAIAVNTVTNKIYAAFTNELAVIDGATGTVQILGIGATGSGPVAIGINTFTNMVYVAKESGSMTVLNGDTNAMTEVSIPAGASSLGINSITNEVYVFGSSTTIVDGSGVARPNPIVTTIAPLPGNTTTANATFTLTAASGFAPNQLPVNRVYVQLDSTEGAWTRATGSNPFTATFSGLSTGAHTLYAFGADGQDAPLHTASQSAPLVGTIASYAFTVGTAPLATPAVSLASSANPSTAGQAVTFTATVSGSAGTPTGTVDFRNGASVIAGCSAVALSAGAASCTTTALPAGTNGITAAYSGNAAYSPATSAVITQTVNTVPAPKVNPTVALASSSNPSDVGSSVTFTANISGSNGTPTGTVDFRNGSTSIAGCSAAVVSAGKATCTTSALAQGTLSISAQYSGNAAYNAASATLTQTVRPVAAPLTAAEMIYPANGMTLMGTTQVFDWTTVKGATYTLLAGSSPGASDLGKATDVSVSEWTLTGLPSDGRKAYVRLITKVGTATQARDYQYFATSKGAVEMSNPKLGKRLKGTTETFKWKDEKGASRYTLAVGTTLGGREIASVGPTSEKSATVKNLPSNGSWIYVRLGWTMNGTTYFRDYAYRSYDKSAGDDDRDHDRWGKDDDDDDDDDDDEDDDD